AERLEPVFQHGLGEPPSLIRGEGGDQALLGIRQVLHGHRGEDVHASAWRTLRARATSSARVAMMVCAVTGETPSRRTSGIWPLSRSSRTSRSSQRAYARATPAAETGRPDTAMSRPAGPETASSRTMGLIRHRDQARRHAEAPGDGPGRFAQASPLPEEARPVEMGRQVSIAEVEPGGLPEAHHVLERAEALVAHPPALGLIDQSREHVAD